MRTLKTRWDKSDMLANLDEFHHLYGNRPVQDNTGGMKSAHMFPTWYIVKKLQPEFIIESGVWYGQGTWLLEQASPTTKIISIDIDLRNRKYISQKVTYLTTDFTKTDWSAVTPSNTLVFLDDHQNFFDRFLFCIKRGFKYIISEDNYPTQQGDCYTPKKILANHEYVIDKEGSRSTFPANNEHYLYLFDHLSVYQEMPPIFKAKQTRWGDNWDDNYPTPEPLLDEKYKDKYPEFYNEKLDYTWLCYMELHK